MTDTPKEIWCSTGLYWDYKDDWSEGSWRDNDNCAGVKYVRADRIEELEAKLAKAVEALQWLKVEIRGHGFSDEGRMLTMCISTLAELTGGKDE